MCHSISKINILFWLQPVCSQLLPLYWYIYIRFIYNNEHFLIIYNICVIHLIFIVKSNMYVMSLSKQFNVASKYFMITFIFIVFYRFTHWRTNNCDRWDSIRSGIIKYDACWKVNLVWNFFCGWPKNIYFKTQVGFV